MDMIPTNDQTLDRGENREQDKSPIQTELLAHLETEPENGIKKQGLLREELDGVNVEIPNKLFFRIGDVADLVGVKPYVLRYWETEFPSLSPRKSNTGQRVYKRTDVESLMLIKHLLYKERYSIEGARRRIRELREKKDLKSFTEQKVMTNQRTLRI